MECVYLALGSNLGDREEYLRAGMRGLLHRGIDIVKSAAIYSTEPLEVLDQPWFLNTVVEVKTTLAPEELLVRCLDVEKQNDRIRDARKGPRTLDIDVIFYGNVILHNPHLTIPHPSFAARRFVLVPLTEIAPDFVDPLSGKTIQRLLAECTDPSTVELVARF
jgi:2-amino-4-hydroxy-6-hydroxymethyldihydropteridine diphosphokinase